MDSLLIVDVIVPEHVCVWNVCLRMSLVRAVDTGELDRIADKEDRQTVENKVLVAFLGE